jgi:hypothetical protein
MRNAESPKLRRQVTSFDRSTDHGYDKYNPNNTETIIQGIERSTWAVLLNNTRPPKIPSHEGAKRKRKKLRLAQDASDLKDPQHFLKFTPRPLDEAKSLPDILELWDSDLIELPVFIDRSLLHSSGSYTQENASSTAERDMIDCYWDREGQLQPVRRVPEAILSPLQTSFDTSPNTEAERLDGTHALHDSAHHVSVLPSPCHSSNRDPSLFSSFEEFLQGT